MRRFAVLMLPPQNNCFRKQIAAKNKIAFQLIDVPGADSKQILTGSKASSDLLKNAIPQNQFLLLTWSKASLDRVQNAIRRNQPLLLTKSKTSFDQVKNAIDQNQLFCGGSISTANRRMI